MDDLITKFMTKFNEFLIAISHGLEGIKFKENTIGSDIFLINFIGANPNSNMTDVSNFLKTIPSTTTRRIDKLVSLGVVERFSGKTDRRSVKLKLTTEGQGIYNHYLQKRLASIEELTTRYNSAEIKTFLSILDFLLQKGKKMLD